MPSHDVGVRIVQRDSVWRVLHGDRLLEQEDTLLEVCGRLREHAVRRAEEEERREQLRHVRVDEHKVTNGTVRLPCATWIAASSIDTPVPTNWMEFCSGQS